MNQDWDIKPCSGVCRGCERELKDKETYLTLLSRGPDGFQRVDYCDPCAYRLERKDIADNMVWRGEYRKPVPPAAEPVKKETAESLLRRLMESSDGSRRNAIYVLAVMLERKRVLVERETRTDEDGGTTLVYELRRTGEMFLIPDPKLRLDELEDVQAEVTELLGRNDKEQAAPQSA